MEREASTSRTVESAIVACRGGSRCRSTSRRSVGSSQSSYTRSSVWERRDRGDEIHYFDVTRPQELFERVFPFFGRFRLRSPTERDLAIFREITELVLSGRHVSTEGIGDILILRSPMTEAESAGMTRVHSRRIEGPGILRGHTQGSICEARWMKIWSTPHSDMGEVREL
jgi:hypothetical protein